MPISFDPAKNERNIAERGLSFERISELDWLTAIAIEDARRDYGERRIRVMALLEGRLHVAVIRGLGINGTANRVKAPMCHLRALPYA